MRQTSNFVALILSAAALAACGADEHGTSQTAVSRNFDELARVVASCGDSLGECSQDAEDKAARDACQSEFFDCQDSVGKEAESELADAISQCQERATTCRSDASMDATREKCANALRTCIGEARAQTSSDADQDGGAPGSKAPTYQCFGQLRECIADEKAPRECAAAARACVLAAVQPSDVHRPTMKPPVDAGASDAGRSGSGGANMGAAGKGNAGSPANAGTGGTAGARPMPGRAGTGGAAGVGGAGGAGGMPSEQERQCVEAHQACLMSGEKPMKCAKDQRACMKLDEDEAP